MSSWAMANCTNAEITKALEGLKATRFAIAVTVSPFGVHMNV